MPFKIKETIVGVSIAIILLLFVIFGVRAFYKEPRYNDFCGHEIFASRPHPARDLSKEINYSLCAKIELKNADFIQDCVSKEGMIVYEQDENGCQAVKECTFCQKDYNSKISIYNRNVFIITGSIGIAVIILSAVLSLVSVSAGLLGGGTLIIIYNAIRHWNELADWARFIILGIALAVLIWIGYTKLNKKQ